MQPMFRCGKSTGPVWLEISPAARPAPAELHGQTFVVWNKIRWSPFLNLIPDWQRHLFEPRPEFDQVEIETDGHRCKCA